MNKFIPLFVVMAFGLLIAERPAWAGNSTISTNTTTAQSLTSSGTLTITSTGTLNVSGSSGKAAVTFNASSNGYTIAVTNSGTIEQSGTALNSNNNYALTDSVGHTIIFINNNAGASIETADSDVIHISKSSDTVTINNSGTIVSLNASAGSNQAINLSGINGATPGNTTINNNNGGLILATGADAIRPAVNGVINNAGTIKAISVSGSGSDGIEAAASSGNTGNSGVTINNMSTGLIEGGRHGITGGNTDTTTSGSFTMTISNTLGGIIQGDNGSGINIDGFSANEVVTVNNAGTITGNGVTGDGDGVDVDGLVNITNSGKIQSLNANADVSEGVTVGGGTITNSGTIEGSVTLTGSMSGAVGRGITLAGLDKDPTTGGAIPIEKTYAPSVIVNSGLIKGDSDSGIAILGINTTVTGSYSAANFAVTITNTLGGVIEGNGSVAAIDGSALANGEGTASSNNETVINYGTIKADGTGKAISLGSGNNSVQIVGASASIIGDMSGGALTGTNTAALTIDPSTGHSFSYGGVISNFTSVEIKSGTVTFSGLNTYNGTTTIDAATLDLTGSGTIGTTTVLTIASGGTFDLGGGTVTVGSLQNSGSINNGTVNTSSSGTISGLSGSTSFNKNSAGTTTITGTNTYTGGTTVSQGKLAVNGSVTGNVAVQTGAEVGGHGTIGGTITGSGSVGPGNSPGILTAGATDPTGGLSYNFELTQAGAPTWSNASASGNDVLHLTAALPFTAPLTSANDINVYFSGLSLTYEGGFFTNGSTDDLSSNIANATYNYYLLDNTHGTFAYNGNMYDLVTAPVIETTQYITGANFGDGTVNGWTIQFISPGSIPEPSTYMLIGLGLAAVVMAARRRGPKRD